MPETDKIFSILDETFPNAQCELDFGSVFELLVAVILSAQCTDRRVNVVTKELFKIASTPEEFAEMDQTDLEKAIFSCGFYRNKAKNIIAASKAIVESGGKVPDTFDGLLALPGVGRKTANVVYDVGFGGDGIPVDTHVFRVSNRLGIAPGKTPREVEDNLMNIIPEGSRNRAHHLLIFLGRYRCKAISPACDDCPLNPYCKFFHDKRG